jgi:hypothetical protein
VRTDGVDSELTGSNRFDRGPVVSPSGRFITIARYVMGAGDESWTLRLVDRESGLERDIVTGSRSWPAATFWQDDALLVTFTGPDGTQSWVVLADPGAAGTPPQPLFASGATMPMVATPFGAASRR